MLADSFVCMRVVLSHLKTWGSLLVGIGNFVIKGAYTILSSELSLNYGLQINIVQLAFDCVVCN